MESIQQFELILMSSKETSSPSKCSKTEDIPFGDSFAIDLFSKSDDEFTGIDFLAELDKDEKMYLDGKFCSLNLCNKYKFKSILRPWLLYSTK